VQKTEGEYREISKSINDVRNATLLTQRAK